MLVWNAKYYEYICIFNILYVLNEWLKKNILTKGVKLETIKWHCNKTVFVVLKHDGDDDDGDDDDDDDDDDDGDDALPGEIKNDSFKKEHEAQVDFAYFTP